MGAYQLTVLVISDKHQRTDMRQSEIEKRKTASFKGLNWH